MRGRVRRAAAALLGLLLLAVLAVALGAQMPRPDAPAAPVEAPQALEGGAVREDLRFSCGGATCAGWLFRPAEAGGRAPPVVVMGHGFAGTRDVALPAFARAFAARGLAAFVFDYRGFGASGGGPRQLVDPWRQLEDWQAAMDFVRDLAAVDGARLALWGSSMGAGHALVAAARDGGVAAVVAQAPLVDTTKEGEAAALGPAAALRLLLWAWADLARAIVSDEALQVPAIAPPGHFAMIADRAAWEAFERLVGPGSRYRNEVAARSILTFDDYNPAVQAADLAVPTLLIASRSDRFARFDAARAFAASHPHARLAEVGGDHFEIYASPHREEAARLAAEFLVDALRPPQPAGLAGSASKRPVGRARRQAATTGSSSAGLAPWRITPSQPRSNWPWMVRTHASGLPVAAGASQASGINVATCASSCAVAEASRAPRKPATNGSSRKRRSTSGSQPFVRTIRSP